MYLYFPVPETFTFFRRHEFEAQEGSEISKVIAETQPLEFEAESRGGKEGGEVVAGGGDECF